VAEVGSKEFFVGKVDVHVSGDNLSFSPFTLLLSSAVSSCISLNAFFDCKFISNHELWSTEIVIWDQVNSGVPGANTSIAVEAIIFVVLLKAGSPLSIFKFLISALDWVAELFGEERWFHWSS
jgi:hypothetical protein